MRVSLLWAATGAVAVLMTSCKPSAEEAAFATAMRGFYLWRCGTEVECDHNGNHYHHPACHLDDGYTAYIDADTTVIPTDARSDHRVDGCGGWHDAGDFGKYTVNAGVTMAALFYAWDHFSDKIEKVDLGIPSSGASLPVFLQELKWETDFLFKMEYPDGSGRVAHKLTRTSFAPFIMPEDDHEPRYFTVWSSAATADYAAMMAMASRYFEPYNHEYAAVCLEAAVRSYAFLEANPEDKHFEQGDFQTGGYQTSDPDDRLWAAAEMWQTTGEGRYLEQLEAGLRRLAGDGASSADDGSWNNLVTDEWDWGDVAPLASFTYALSEREGRDAELLEHVRAAIVSSAERLSSNAASDPYGCALKNYFWGCNGTACRQSINLHVADIITGGDKYQPVIEGIAEYILGNNYYGRSFVTGVGPNPPMFPHDRRSAADGIDAPWPGYLVGGGHTPTDWVDKEEDYSRNEIAINWQAALVYLLAARL